MPFKIPQCLESCPSGRYTIQEAFSGIQALQWYAIIESTKQGWSAMLGNPRAGITYICCISVTQGYSSSVISYALGDVMRMHHGHQRTYQKHSKLAVGIIIGIIIISFKKLFSTESHSHFWTWMVKSIVNSFNMVVRVLESEKLGLKSRLICLERHKALQEFLNFLSLQFLIL